MTIDEAIEVLELYNQWRKGADIPMETPVRIGMAIDLAVCELKNLRIAHVSCQREQLLAFAGWLYGNLDKEVERMIVDDYLKGK